MDIVIGNFNSSTLSVPVTFTDGDIVHQRDVRACLTKVGNYDKEATAARVEEVAAGVAQKIALGVIAAGESVPQAPDPQPEDAPAPAG